jgi:5-hydroxyisourate hydrolase
MLHKAGERDLAGGISVHAVDVANGRPAQGLRVEIWRLVPDRVLLADVQLGADGTLRAPVTAGEAVTEGDYEVRFHIGDFYRVHASQQAQFLDIVPFRFVIRRAEEHFHLPLKFTPWGYSLFRGA